MSVISKLRAAVARPVAEVEHAVERGEQVVEKEVSRMESSAAALGKDTLELVEHGVEAALQKRFGPRLVATARLPDYTKLSSAALEQARARSVGLSTPQACIQGGNGKRHEPVTLEVAGSPARLQAALEKAGWVEAKPETLVNDVRSGLSLASSVVGLPESLEVSDPGGPMSTMYLHGKPQVMAFEKNDDHHRGRDHLRIFATGRSDARGQPIWAIAATRDTAFGLNTKTLHGWHEIDSDIDSERDQVMADLLRSSDVADWKVARGTRDPADAAAISKSFTTDGDVYQVSLGSPGRS